MNALHGQRVIVVGGGSGIGLAVAAQAVEAGAHVAIAGRSAGKLEAALHADNVNQTSVGIELVQGRDATLYEAQLDAAVRLIDFLTRRFGIQRQIPHSYAGAVERLAALAVDDVVGVLGHRDLSPRRGPGDPGSAIMNALATAGYEPVDYGRAHDLDLWKRRQAQLALDPIDGVPGPETVDRLRAAGHAHGLWISRPGDLGR